MQECGGGGNHNQNQERGLLDPPGGVGWDGPWSLDLTGHSKTNFVHICRCLSYKGRSGLPEWSVPCYTGDELQRV